MTERHREPEVNNEWMRLECTLQELGDKISEELTLKASSPSYPVVENVRNDLLRFFVKLFENGLRPGSEPTECYLRVLPTTAENLGNDIKETLTYEVQVHLTPRRAKDGDSGFYTLRFTSHVQTRISKKHGCFAPAPLGSEIGVIVTKVHRGSREAVKDQIEASQRESIETAVKVLRDALSRPFSGGAPGLGKRS